MGRRIEDEGEEPDYRFTLANERTFLAWVRTSLALLAAGVAVQHFGEPLDVEAGRTALAVAAIALSAASVMLAYRRWGDVQRAMRLGQPLPESLGIPMLAVVMAGLAVGAGILVVAA
jgi:putative membrane protein